MTLVDGIGSLATRVATEFKGLYAKFGAANGLATLDGTGKLPLGQLTSHAHDASDISAGTLSALRLPRSLWGTLSNTTANTNNWAVNADSFTMPLRLKFTLLHNSGLSVPTGTPADGQTYKLCCLASGATRTWTFAAGFRLSTGLTSRTFSIPSGEALIAAVEYSSDLAAWVVTAATVSAT